MENYPILSDKQVLDNLEGDHELLSELRVTFLDTVPQILKELSEEDISSTTLLRSVHSLKSSAGSIGAEQLSYLAKNTEKNIRDGKFDLVKPLLSQIMNCIERTVSELRKTIL